MWVTLHPGCCKILSWPPESNSKGYGSWRNIRGTGITLGEARQLVRVVKTRLKQDDLNMFDWDMTDRDPGFFDTKMMAFLWFKEGVTPMVRTRALNDIQQGLTLQPLPFKGVNVRATIGNFPWSDVGVCKIATRDF